MPSLWVVTAGLGLVATLLVVVGSGWIPLGVPGEWVWLRTAELPGISVGDRDFGDDGGDRRRAVRLVRGDGVSVACERGRLASGSWVGLRR